MVPRPDMHAISLTTPGNGNHSCRREDPGEAGNVANPRAQVITAAGEGPSKHQLALMIRLAVLPTLIVLNLSLGRLLADLSVVPRTFVLATVAVRIVIYGLMPQLPTSCTAPEQPLNHPVAHHVW